MEQVYATVTTVMVLAAVALTLVALYHLVVPFFLSRRDQVRFELLDQDLRRVEELAARKSALVQMLREIEFDHQTHKISDEDFAELKRGYERQAVRVMRELDALRGGTGWEAAVDGELARRLEALPAGRADAPKSALAHPPEEPALDDEPAADGVVCPSCHKRMEPDARFCSQCGYAFSDPAGSDSDPEADPHAADDAGANDDDATSHALASALAVGDAGQVTP